MCWRRNLDSMQKRLLAVMNNNIPDIPHDITLVVGKEKVQISCHKMFLAILSPVFETMFSRHHNTQQKPITGMEIVSISSTSECNPIVIPDVHPDGLKNVVKYAYTGVMNVDLKDVIVTMYACHKYDIPELFQHCSQLMHSNLSVDNVVTIYQASVLLKELKLKENAWEFIERNAAALLNSEQFNKFSEENLLKFLKLDEMPGLKTEADVFKALLKWGNIQCDREGRDRTIENVRTVLKNAISLIRYTTMEADEFNEVVASEMLSLQECVQLLTYFTSSPEKRFAIANTLKYPIKNRTGHTIIFCNSAIKDLAKGRSCQTSSYNKPYNYPTGFFRDVDYTKNDHCSEGDFFTITGNIPNLKLKSLGVAFPLNCIPTEGSISVVLYDRSWNNFPTQPPPSYQATKMRTPKILEICYIDFDVPVALGPNVKYQIVVNCCNGTHVKEPFEHIVRYSKELLNVSKILWTTSNQGLSHELVLEESQPNRANVWGNLMPEPEMPPQRAFERLKVRQTFASQSFFVTKNQQATFKFDPIDCAIWAMQFEN